MITEKDLELEYKMETGCYVGDSDALITFNDWVKEKYLKLRNDEQSSKKTY